MKKPEHLNPFYISCDILMDYTAICSRICVCVCVRGGEPYFTHIHKSRQAVLCYACLSAGHLG